MILLVAFVIMLALSSSLLSFVRDVGGSRSRASSSSDNGPDMTDVSCLTAASRVLASAICHGCIQTTRKSNAMVPRQSGSIGSRSGALHRKFKPAAQRAPKICFGVQRDPPRKFVLPRICTGRLHRRRGQCRYEVCVPKEESIAAAEEKGSPFIVAVSVGLAAVTSAKSLLFAAPRGSN